MPRRALSALPLILALAVTGCAAQHTVGLPAKSRQQTAPTALGGQTLTARQQVIAAYTGYWQAFAAAMSSQNAARARAIMAPYEPASAIAQTIKADRRVWAAHETAYGSAAPHILDVRMAGNRALVHDCLDLSHFGAQNTPTIKSLAQLTPGRFLSAPGLWIGLVFAAAFLAAVIRLRRYRGPF